MAPRADRLVWVDLEMTGLDPQNHVIVEIATIVTEADLTVVAEGPNLVIHQPDEMLARMAPVVVEMHARSGLTERVRQSAVTLEDAEQATVDFVSQHIVPGTAPLAGNSVWKDKEFIDRYMVRFAALMHYRIVDVSTLKELVARWFPPEMKAPKKKETHRALDDIRESIEELAYYRANVIKPPAPGSR